METEDGEAGAFIRFNWYHKPGDEVFAHRGEELVAGQRGYYYNYNLNNWQGHDFRGHITRCATLADKNLRWRRGYPYHWQMAGRMLENIPVLVAPFIPAGSLCFLTLALYATVLLCLGFSQTVAYPKQHDIIADRNCWPCLVGIQSKYSGLLAARKVLQADIIIVSMGPGIVGTGTPWGFTGIEQGQILNAVHSLEGIPVAVPRISFADPRPRHRGISHHSLTVLERVCLVEVVVPLPDLPADKMGYILNQLQAHNLMEKHTICLQDNPEILDILRNSGLKHSTMGRGIEQEQEFFLAWVLLPGQRKSKRKQN